MSEGRKSDSFADTPSVLARMGIQSSKVGGTTVRTGQPTERRRCDFRAPKRRPTVTTVEGHSRSHIRMGTNPAMCAEAFEIYVPDPSAKEEFSLPEPHIRKRPPGVLQRKSDIGVSSVSKTDHDDALGHVLNHRVASRLSNPLGEFVRGECHCLSEPLSEVVCYHASRYH